MDFETGGGVNLLGGGGRGPPNLEILVVFVNFRYDSKLFIIYILKK